MLNFGPLFLAAVLVLERRGPFLIVIAQRCTAVNAGLCCPLEVERKKIILKRLPTSGGKTSRFMTSIVFGYLLFICFKYLLAFISPQWWIILTCSESWCVGLKLFCQHDMCMAVLIPLVLLILGLRICCVSIKPALYFVCQSTVCLLSSRSKQSCLHVVI